MNTVILSRSFIVSYSLERFFNEKLYSEYIHTIKKVEDLDKIQNKIDFIFIDLKDRDIVEINNIKNLYIDTKIMIYDSNGDIDKFIKLINIGIDSYITEIPSEDDFLYIINSLIKGRKYYDSIIVEKFTEEEYGNKDISSLSSREIDVLKAVKRGLTNKMIGEELEISEHTVKKHITNVLSKLGLKNRIDIIKYRIQNY